MRSLTGAVTAEVKNADGGWESGEPNNDSVGYITYSDTGYMGVHVMPQDRTMFADSQQPTAKEVQTALRGYSAYYGPYSVHADEDDRFLIHHRAGNINPRGVSDAKRFYDLEGDRLVLTPAPVGGRKADATRRVVWERLPDASLSAEAKRLSGSDSSLYTDRYTERDGELVWHGPRNEGRAGYRV